MDQKLSRRGFIASGMAALAFASTAGRASAAGCDGTRMFGSEGEICSNFSAPPTGAIPPVIDSEDVWLRYSAAPRTVEFSGDHAVGSILIDQRNQYLYFVNRRRQAIQYVVGVGRSGEEMNATLRDVFDKQEFPYYDDGRGNRNNPLFQRGPAAMLGARGLAMRELPSGINRGHMIHGTNRPDLLARPDGERKVSAGCIRMHNADVMDLYNRVQVGARVYVYTGNELSQIVRVRHSSLTSGALPAVRMA